jgi:hypothetical protein
MTPNPKLPTPLYAQIARQMALVNSPAVRYLNSPAFAYLRSPAFRVATEHIRLAHEMARPGMLAIKAFKEQRRQAEAMTREFASWRHQTPAPIPMDTEDEDVVWSSYPPDPNFGLRHKRWTESS